MRYAFTLKPGFGLDGIGDTKFFESLAVQDQFSGKNFLGQGAGAE